MVFSCSASGYDDVLLAIDQPDETVFIKLCHITGVEPAIVENFCGSFRVLVVFDHDAGALDGKLADLFRADLFALITSFFGS